MNKEFVPYEIALAMKELGFDNTSCLGVYYSDGSEIEFKSCETQYYAQKGFRDGVLAPLFQQAFRWFRDEQKLFHSITKVTEMEFEYRIKGIEHKIDWFFRHEEAELACLRKLIEIVKKM